MKTETKILGCNVTKFEQKDEPEIFVSCKVICCDGFREG